MPNICIFTLGRTSCENFIEKLEIPKWNLNSFDFLYRGLSFSEAVKTVPKNTHVCKIYIETIENDEVQKLVKHLKTKKYIFVHFFRTDTLKHYLTKKLQDNLVGAYGKDYKQFEFDEEDYKRFQASCEQLTNCFQALIKPHHLYDVEIGLTNKKQSLDELVGGKIRFRDAFDKRACEQFVSGLK